MKIKDNIKLARCKKCKRFNYKDDGFKFVLVCPKCDGIILVGIKDKK